MINGRVSRIDESLRISKHFVLNGLQQTEREAGDLHTNAFHYLDTFFFLAAVHSACNGLWFSFSLKCITVSWCKQNIMF